VGEVLAEEVKDDIKKFSSQEHIRMSTTLCIRCGKLRIVSKTWSEKVNGSLVTYTQTVCPDSECQSKVESELQKKIDKVRDIQKKSLERRKLIKRNRKSK